MSDLARLISIYARIARTYVRWAPSLLQLAAAVFVPLGLIEAITIEAEIVSLSISSGLALAALTGALVALTVIGLIGEVFYSGVVAASLTHAEHERLPGLREISGRLNYRRLIAVDLLYVLVVAVGLIFLVVPGVAAFVWLGLAGPVVEIERRTVWGAFRRSWDLVRGRFWTVLLVLAPIQILGDGLADFTTSQIHHLAGDSLPATWAAESVSNVVLSPIYAVAAVLLTLDLIAEKDGTA